MVSEALLICGSDQWFREGEKKEAASIRLLTVLERKSVERMSKRLKHSLDVPPRHDRSRNSFLVVLAPSAAKMWRPYFGDRTLKSPDVSRDCLPVR